MSRLRLGLVRSLDLSKHGVLATGRRQQRIDCLFLTVRLFIYDVCCYVHLARLPSPRMRRYLLNPFYVLRNVVHPCALPTLLPLPWCLDATLHLELLGGRKYLLRINCLSVRQVYRHIVYECLLRLHLVVALLNLWEQLRDWWSQGCSWAWGSDARSLSAVGGVFQILIFDRVTFLQAWWHQLALSSLQLVSWVSQLRTWHSLHTYCFFYAFLLHKVLMLSRRYQRNDLESDLISVLCRDTGCWTLHLTGNLSLLLLNLLRRSHWFPGWEILHQLVLRGCDFLPVYFEIMWNLEPVEELQLLCFIAKLSTLIHIVQVNEAGHFVLTSQIEYFRGSELSIRGNHSGVSYGCLRPCVVLFH